MAGALDGITVLDLTQGQAGALATMFLCDNGARVIRVEAQGGHRARQSPGYKAWDRGKESIVLDISGDARTFDKLVQKADALVESFAPSSSFQAVVDYKRLAAINPRLVQCSITAYGREGPLKDEPPIDDLVMARTGILAAQPGFRPGPVHVVHPVPSVGAGILAAQGIVASLFAREKTGLGRSVETSLMAGALLFAPKVVGERLKPRPFQAIPAGGGPFYSVFECADGEWIQIGCIHGGFVDIAAAVMGIADVVSDPKYGDGRWPQSEEARRELFGIVAGVIKTRPYKEWAELFETADVPHARACTTEDAFDNPQVRFNELVIELEDPEVGRVTQIGLPIKLSGTPGSVKGPRALPGQHTDSVLAELAGGDDPGPAPINPGPFEPPLNGINVLEMTNVIAGPTAGKLLSDLGADVIKLESLDGDISRPGGSTYFYYLNSNKRSISINTRTAEGKEAARRLAARADILLANMRPGATDRMGLGTEALEQLNPRIIQAHVTAFGWEGPFAHRPGVDPLAQAWMGLQRAQGGAENPPVFLAQLAPTDFTAGAMGALGAIMALFARERTGAPQRIDTNLLNGGALMTSDAFMKHKGKPPLRLTDKGHYGLSALHRLYETAQGWLYLVAETQKEWLALCKAIGRNELARDARFTLAPKLGDNDAALSHALAEIFKQKASEEWLQRLNEAGVPCAPVLNLHDERYFSDPHIVANGMMLECSHPVLGAMKYATGGIRLGNTARISHRRTPLLGEHTRETLAEAGYSQEEIEELYHKGIAKTEQPP